MVPDITANAIQNCNESNLELHFDNWKIVG